MGMRELGRGSGQVECRGNKGMVMEVDGWMDGNWWRCLQFELGKEKPVKGKAPAVEADHGSHGAWGRVGASLGLNRLRARALWLD
ncbi:hypothetical protein CDL15_Pgr013338 [Punica granatum]|uniref:Uncharacterized protein n=1 Tax=Punica granatum TaxID=22663 RepID=A0A218WNL8_PUNGR|nr:hypothetical protein CDL15_Pgr013338 [Punica granatum]